MEKLKCVKTVNGLNLEARRVTESEAAIYIASGNWRYTSKSVYKKFVKDSIQKYSGGKFGSSVKHRMIRKKSSTKVAGERVQHIKIATTHMSPELVLHSAITFESEKDPRTGGFTTTKQGKAAEVARHFGTAFIRIHDKVIRHNPI